MKKCILLLCLLFACMATTFAQTDTIRFTIANTCNIDRIITIYASSDTVKFTLEKKGEKPIVHIVERNTLSRLNIERAEAKYKIYDIQGKIATFYAEGIDSLELNNCTNIDTLEVYYSSYSNSYCNIQGHIAVTNCHLKKIKGSNWGYIYTDNVSSVNEAYTMRTRTNFRANDLTIRNCEDLEILEFSHCGLDVDDESCHNLQKLDCSKGIIAALDFKSCDSLKILNCYATNIRALNYLLDLSNCTKLEELDCSTFSPTLDLSDIERTYYTIDSINVSGCINLRKLSCKNQAIAHLDVSGCSNLKYLYCRGAFNSYSYYGSYYSACDGRLKSLNITGCDRLQYIDCNYQPLDSLDASNLTGLRTLVIPRGEGGSKYALKKLNVSGCTNLIQLDCSAYVKIVQYLAGSDYYYRGRLQYLDASGCTNLESLNLRYIYQLNTFQHLDISGCTKLKELSASGCELTFLGVSGCTNLQTLRCAGNKLKNLDLSGCDSLRSLFCYENQLSTLNAGGCSALTEMEAQNNALPLSECYTLPQCNDRKLTPQNIYVYCTVDRGLDLSGEMSFDGYATSYYSVKLNNEVATEGQDYTIKDNMVNFLTGGSFEIILRNAAIKKADVYYHVTVPHKVKTPRIKSSQDTLTPGSKVSIICNTEDAQIYYTLDGTDPSETSLRYYYPFELNESATIKAIAVRYGWTNSDIATASFIVKDPNDDNNDGPLTIAPLQPQIALNVYPNPCGDILYIETSQNDKDGEIHAFRILDLQGREQICAPGSVRQIDMSRLPAGVYLLEATGKNGAVCRHKIIKR